MIQILALVSGIYWLVRSIYVGKALGMGNFYFPLGIIIFFLSLIPIANIILLIFTTINFLRKIIETF
jgi:hypothetical protein